MAAVQQRQQQQRQRQRQQQQQRPQQHSATVRWTDLNWLSPLCLRRGPLHHCRLLGLVREHSQPGSRHPPYPHPPRRQRQRQRRRLVRQQIRQLQPPVQGFQELELEPARRWERDISDHHRIGCCPGWVSVLLLLEEALKVVQRVSELVIYWSHRSTLLLPFLTFLLLLLLLLLLHLPLLLLLLLLL